MRYRLARRTVPEPFRYPFAKPFRKPLPKPFGSPSKPLASPFEGLRQAGAAPRPHPVRISSAICPTARGRAAETQLVLSGTKWAPGRRRLGSTNVERMLNVR